MKTSRCLLSAERPAPASNVAGCPNEKAPDMTTGAKALEKDAVAGDRLLERR